MTSGDLNQISRAIGALESEVARGAESRAVIHKKLDEISKNISAMAKEFAGHVSDDNAVATEVGRLREESEESKKFRYKAVALFAVSAAILGALGAKAVAIAESAFKVFFRA